MSIELTILLPVRNEGLNLKIMLQILRAVVEESHEVLVVVDSPQDSSIQVVETIRPAYPELRWILNKSGRGVIHAIRAGVTAAEGQAVMIFAADEVGPVLAIEDMMALLREGCDFVSCTRYAYGGRRLGGSLVGGALSRLANFLFRVMTQTPFSDATTGIKLFRKDVFASLQLESRPVGWACAFEMAIKAQWAGLRLGEVPIVSIDRLYGGKSTFRLLPWVREYGRLFLWGWVHGIRRGHYASRKVTVRIPNHFR
jgi:glycosyltransferase involved in cell wall biosynthesis